MKLSAALTWMMVACLAAVIGVWIVAGSGMIYRWRSGETALGVAMLTLAYAALARLMALGIDRGKAVGFLRAGLLVSAASYAAWLGMMFWPQAQKQDHFLSWLVVCTSLAGISAWMGITGGIWLLRVRFLWSRLVRLVTIALFLAATAATVHAVVRSAHLDENESGYAASEFAEKASRRAGALFILGGLGFLTLVAASDPLRSVHDPNLSHERRRFGVTCPRCGSRGRLQTGGDACGACGLQIKVRQA